MSDDAEEYRAGYKQLTGYPVRRLMRLIALEWKDISIIYLYAVLAGLINLSLPLGIQAIMGLVLSGETSSSWYLLITIVILGVAFAGGMQIMQMIISERLQQRVFTKAAFDFAFRVPRWKLESILKQYAPELMNRFFDIVTLQKDLSKILVDFSTALLQIIFGLILLGFYHSYFTIFGILSFGGMILLFRVTFPRGLETSLVESRFKYKVAAWLEELARTMALVKLAGYTDMHLNKTDKMVTKYLKGRQDHSKVLRSQYVLVIAFRTLITAGVIIIGSLLVFNEKITLAQFVASEIVLILVINSIEKLLSSLSTIYDVLTSLEKVGQVTDIEIEGEKGIAFEDIDTGKGVEIVMKNVTYQFPGDERVTLKDMSLTIPAGGKVCVAGWPGSGRSTLINLVASMLHNYEGMITFNDITLKNLNLISLRSYVGENLSKKELIHGTIEENISMGREDITYHDVKKAVDAVGLTEYIQSTKEGFNTIIVPEDITIPTSIVTKITMARSIAEKPHLFLLDDFLNSIQHKDKERIVDSLTGDDKFWTLLGASNDIVFAQHCDLIVVMKDGAIYDQGDYSYISKQSYFHDLFMS